VAGEQFAHADAVAALRAIPEQDVPDEWVVLNAVDPLNLVGIVTPGVRLPAVATNRLLYGGGTVVAQMLGRTMQCARELDEVHLLMVKSLLQGGTAPASETRATAAAAGLPWIGR
jgi:ATP-dependent Lhr-like helicase